MQNDEYFDSEEFRELLEEYENAVNTGMPVFTAFSYSSSNSRNSSLSKYSSFCIYYLTLCFISTLYDLFFSI